MAKDDSLNKDTYQAILDRAAHYSIISSGATVPNYLSSWQLKTIAGYYDKKNWSWNYATGVMTSIYALDSSTYYDNMVRTGNNNVSMAYQIPQVFGGAVANGSVSPASFTSELDSSVLSSLYNDLLRLGRFAVGTSISSSNTTCNGSAYWEDSAPGEDEIRTGTVNFSNKHLSDYIEIGTGEIYAPYPRYKEYGGGQTTRRSGEYNKLKLSDSMYRILLPFNCNSCLMLFGFVVEWYDGSTSYQKRHDRFIRCSRAISNYWQCSVTDTILNDVKQAVCPSIHPSKSDSGIKWFDIQGSCSGVFIITF